MTDVEHYTPAGAVDQSGVWSDVAGGGQEAKSSDEAKNTETLEKKRKDIQKIAEQVREQLPPRTSGLIIMNREGGIQAFELYRSSRAFGMRKGFIESILMDKVLTETWPMEPEAAWVMAIQLVYRMREITDSVSILDSMILLEKLLSELILPLLNLLPPEQCSGPKQNTTSISLQSFPGPQYGFLVSTYFCKCFLTVIYM